MTGPSPQSSQIRVAYLTNILAPYWKLICEQLRERYILRIFLSTPMEKNRPWAVDWGPLDVVVQRTLTLQRRWKHPGGFTERLHVHLPLDTIAQLRRFRPQVVISNEMGFRTLLASVYRKLNPQCRLIVLAEMAESTERGRGRSRGLVRRWLRDHVDGYLTPGASGARYLDALGVAPAKIFQIGYTSDVHRLSALPVVRPPDAAHRLLYVGQLIERKGLVPFLDALAQWSSHNPQRTLEFVIVGDGPARSRIAAVRLPANLKVTFRGNMAFSDVSLAYEGCGIFALPTFADTWGVVVNEAMAAGLPVLGSMYSQAVEELLEEGRNGWSFHPDDPCDTYASLERALNTPADTLNEMRVCARQTALRYTPEFVATNIDRAFHGILGRA
ncbi:MAG: glycosyltransferase family 4 protein [Acidobacteriaceae bacterium]|nr:glycosyltransferase family 4 protein [Acidobacteriaceae bacterium]